MSSLRLSILYTLGFALAVLPVLSAQAQDVPPPPGAPAQFGAQVSAPGTVVVVQAPPPGYAPIQIIEMPGVYGAGYAPQDPGARIGSLQLELASQQAEYSRYSLGMPITLIIAGGATTAVAGLFFLAYGLVDSVHSTPESSRGTVISGIFTAIGVAALVGGIVTLISRISARRPYGRRINEIKRELASYGVRATLDVRTVPSGAVLTGTLSF